MITLKSKIQLNQEDYKFVSEMRRIQSSMIRTAYKESYQKSKEIKVRSIIRDRFKDQLDSWFQQSAVKYGIGQAKSDLSRKQTSRIFGSTRNFILRSQGLISKEEFKKRRLEPLIVIGEALPTGNRKFEFHIDKVIFKPYRGTRIEIPIKIRRNQLKQWVRAVTQSSQKLIPITVKLLDDEIHFTFETIKQERFKPVKNRIAGIDLNPNYIGVSILDSNKIVSTRLYELKKLTGRDYQNNKLEHETIQICHDIGRWLQYMKAERVVVEKLSFKQGDSGSGRWFNRLTKNRWKVAKFHQILSKYYKLFFVNAAYSSTIGNTLNSNYPDPVAASIELAKRGIRITTHEPFYPDLPSTGYLEDLWKKTEIPDFKSWKELHGFIKNSKQRYRVPVPTAGFRHFLHKRSCVLCLDHLY